MSKMKVIVVASALFIISLSQVTFAQTRTTPVEVKNAPSVTVANTPSVTVTNTPNVSVTNIPSVSISNSPTVNIGNTPSVSVSNTPTVSISSNGNTVLTPTISSGVKLWNSDLTIANGGSGSSSYFSCVGYREVRAIIKLTNTPSNPGNLKVFIECEGTPAGGSFALGYVTFATPTNSVVQNSTFVQTAYACVFTAPALSGQMWFYISNNTGASVTIDSSRSWVWLVN